MIEYDDTHAHFEGTPLETEQLLRRAREAGVTRLMAVGGSTELNAGAIAAAKTYPDQVRLALGFDRDQVDKASPEVWCETLMKLKEGCGVPLAAIGEIGLDYYYSLETRERQVALFSAEMRLASSLGLPVSIHTRYADEDTLKVMDQTPWEGEGLRGAIHCFTGDLPFARALMERGFAISFSGIVTFRNAEDLRKVAAVIPEDRILIETDSPYLAPVPKRGGPNEPGYVVHVAECLARVRGVDVEVIAGQTRSNAERLFGLP